MQRVLDSCRDSRALDQPVGQLRWRLSLLSQRTTLVWPGLVPGHGLPPPPFQPPLPRNEVAMSCLIREKPQLERLTWSR